MSLPKEDLIFLLRLRAQKPDWKDATAKLSKMLGEAAPEEMRFLEGQRAARDALVVKIWGASQGGAADHSSAPFNPKSVKLADVQAKARGIGIPFSGKTRGGLLDALLDHGGPYEPPTLDPDQQALVERFDEARVVVSAGPGAGKTTTLCGVAARAHQERPDARICMLAFNVNAEKILKERLKLFGVRPAPLRLLNDPSAPGVFVATFDKYAFRCRSERGVAPTFGSHSRSMEEAIASGRQPCENWDWVFIDEAQDVTNQSRLINSIDPPRLCGRGRPAPGGLPRRVLVQQPVEGR